MSKNQVFSHSIFFFLNINFNNNLIMFILLSQLCMSKTLLATNLIFVTLVFFNYLSCLFTVFVLMKSIHWKNTKIKNYNNNIGQCTNNKIH